jgi:hypothetical protein
MAKKSKNSGIEGAFDLIVSAIPYQRLKVWKAAYFHPKETFTSEQKNASLSRGALDILAPSIIFAAIVAAIAFIMSIVKPQPSVANALLAVPIIIIAIPAVVLLNWLVFSVLQYASARLLGGSGTFKAQAYLSAIAHAGYYAAIIPLFVLQMIPCIGIIGAVANFFFSIYFLYVMYKAVAVAHKLDTLRGVLAAIVLPFAVLIAIVLIVFAILFAIGITMMAPFIAAMH